MKTPRIKSKEKNKGRGLRWFDSPFNEFLITKVGKKLLNLIRKDFLKIFCTK